MNHDLICKNKNKNNLTKKPNSDETYHAMTFWPNRSQSEPSDQSFNCINKNKFVDILLTTF